MRMVKCFFFTLMTFLVLIFSFSCRNRTKPKEKDIVINPKNLDQRVRENIEETLQFALENEGKVNDTIKIKWFSLVNTAYENNLYKPLWSQNGDWHVTADSLFSFIHYSKEYGLFPSDYHFTSISGIREKILADSISKKNAVLWMQADLLLTDAFLLISKHLKQGRLKYDSINLRADSLLNDDFYLQILHQRRSYNVSSTFHSLEPRNNNRYDSLRKGLHYFLDSALFTQYTYLEYPYSDSIKFFALLQKRLSELNILPSGTTSVDTFILRGAVASYQKSKKLKPTGRVNETTINSLNNNDWEKFVRIAINLDRFKLMPDTMPATYVWVNIPAYRLEVMDYDTLVFDSRIIVGKPNTRTPLLNSNISNFITYPQWTVPYSIIFKEMLPQIQKDTNYLQKQNFMVVDKNDSVIPPSSINWSKVTRKNFPYLIKQRQGDDNSLGVIKFNFRNKYAVYVHDTNARWLFSKTSRALSHGCVRLQQWQKLANFLVRANLDKYPPDSLRAWISRQEKHVVSSFPRVPIYIRYISCEGKGGKVRFFEDIYSEDKMIRQKYFSDKAVL